MAQSVAEEYPHDARRAILAISLVGLSVLLVYTFESLLQAYEVLYLPFGESGPFAALRGIFPGPTYDVILPWQSMVLEQVVPFLLFFWVALRIRLSPFRSTLQIAVLLLLWGAVLALLRFPLLAYAEQVVFSRPLGVSFSYLVGAELTPIYVAGLISDATIFMMLGFTAIAFAYFWSDHPLWNFRGWLDAEDTPYSEEGVSHDLPES
jgi:hypothetical protein